MPPRHKRLIDWPAVAARLAASIPSEKLHPAVVAWAEDNSPRAKWAVAFSGGADSLAALLLVWAHWPQRRRRLSALHFNHRLRGRASDGDERFCARVCAGLGVNLICGTWRHARREASEADARDARLAFFAGHTRVVWLGHQQDDIAESMLMRLARGSGAGGLAAPRPVQAMPGRRVHLRPLLALKKSEVVAALRTAGAEWREDATNARGDFFRNRVRRTVIPAWRKAAQRDALAGAARARELLEEDDAALDAWLDELRPLRADGALDLRSIAGKPRALARRALHRWLLAQPQAGDLARQGFDALLAAVERGAATRHSVGREGFAVIRGGELRFARIGKRSVKLHRSAN
jgi:tRNA(Ile)-lysidine synthase